MQLRWMPAKLEKRQVGEEAALEKRQSATVQHSMSQSNTILVEPKEIEKEAVNNFCLSEKEP